MTGPHGARRLESARKAVTPAEARELRGLYDRLAVASAAAGLELGTSPATLESQGFKDLNARMMDIIARIKEIAG